MKLIRHQNCMLASAAMVLDKHPDVLAELIGHDGREIIFPHLLEPMCRRGYHVQEVIDCAYAYMYAYTVTPIEAIPVATPNNVDMFPVRFPTPNEHRFKTYLHGNIGILTGRTRKCGHAVAWDGESVYDSRGMITSFDDCDMDIDTFWLFTAIISK